MVFSPICYIEYIDCNNLWQGYPHASENQVAEYFGRLPHSQQKFVKPDQVQAISGAPKRIQGAFPILDREKHGLDGERELRHGESSMKRASAEKKLTIQAAAKVLGVSKGTVIQYLNNGQLTRVREGSQVYILMDEVTALSDPDKGKEEIKALPERGKRPGEIAPLRDKGEEPQITAPIDSSGDGDGTTVNLDRDHYEELLTRIGQLELENQNLLRYKESMVDTKAALSQKEKDLQQAEAKLHMKEDELRRLKKMGWWKRAFGRGWKMTGG